MKSWIQILGLAIAMSLMAVGLFAQPANNSCGTAQAVASTSCTAGTTTGADDSWVGSVGCQPGGNIDDVWYSFVATENQLNINVTSSGIGNNVHFVLAESPCGNCGCSFIIAGSVCGPAPLVDSIIGLNIGATYYYTISSDGAAGGFTSCITNVPAVNRPGQDCATASNLCDQSSFGMSSIASGNGAVRGLGSEEDVNTLSCFGSSERQSQWYRFTASQTGTIEFNINPNVSSDDYDFLLLDVTTSGCNLLSGPASVVACNWSGCKGSTGITSAVASEPGVVTSGAGCGGGPAAWIQTPPTITACRDYLLLIDNFSLSNNGFNFIWGGATGGMTGDIGPAGALGFSTSTVSTCPTCQVSVTPSVNLPCYTYEYSWGDGTTSAGATPPPHSYAACGTYTITQTIRDANGCEATTSGTFVCTVLASESLHISGKPTQHSTQLSWNIPSNLDIQSVKVQHSISGQYFDDLGQFERQNNGQITLEMEHDDPAPGRNFYRLMAYDENGNSHISNIATVVFNGILDDFSLYPVPASDWVDLNYHAADEGAIIIDLMDAQGKKVKSIETEVVKGSQSIKLDLNGLPAGLYFVQVKTSKGTISNQFLKQSASR